MKILKVEPAKAPYVKEIENELHAIQEEVGGESLVWNRALSSAAMRRVSLTGWNRTARYRAILSMGPSLW